MDWVKEQEVASRLRVKRASDERHLNEEEDEEDEKDGDEYVQEEKHEEYGEKQGYDDEIDEEEDEEDEDEDEDEDELWDDYGDTKEGDNNAGERSRLHRKGKGKAPSSSKYRGVTLNKSNKSKPWRACISIDGKKEYLGYHATEEEAARAHDAEGARLGRELNFPEEWKNVEDIEAKYEALSYKKGKRKAPSSKYRGVGLNKGSKSKPWRVQITIDGKDKYLGHYATEEEAARAYDAEGARLGRELNFPEEWKNVEDIEGKYEALSYKKGKRKAPSSKYRGVGLNKCSKSKPWQVQITIDGKFKYFGTYATEEEAARAYDAEGARVGRELNFPEEWKNVEDIEAKYEALSYKKASVKPSPLPPSIEECTETNVANRSRGKCRSGSMGRTNTSVLM
jgi:hypothetical protein